MRGATITSLNEAMTHKRLPKTLHHGVGISVLPPPMLPLLPPSFIFAWSGVEVMLFPDWNGCAVVANAIAWCKSDVVRSNKHVHKTSSNTDIQQNTKYKS